ncbi:hypothetical protein XENOCAPTIV_018164 [Xenoophorus captivus]|uniref:CCHC-type domain-containing protein n=1 Tax=Xenoophorus captivus TaxID=1517983 RepID=A0ABV0R176_9TELE
MVWSAPLTLLFWAPGKRCCVDILWKDFSLRSQHKLRLFMLVGVRFEELKRHALHSDDVINDRKKKKVDKRETDLHNAALTLYYSTNQRGSFPQGRGRGCRGRGRGRGQWSRSDACHNCIKLGHWRNECPEKLQRPDSGN